MRGTIVALGLMLGSLPGCYFNFDGVSEGSESSRSSTYTDYGDYGDFDYGETNLTVSNAEMQGKLGTWGFEGTAEVQDTYAYTDYAYIELHNFNNGWSMNGITIEGGIDTLEAGQRFEFDNSYDPYGYGEPSLHVSVLGCSGPSEGNFDYDRTADRVVVDVSAGQLAGQLELKYTAWFPSETGQEDYQVDGSVSVLVE